MPARRDRFQRTEAGAFLALALTVAFLLAAGGCNSDGASSGPPVYPVTGVVKVKGQPVVGADIVFSLKDGTGSSFGRTDATGRYELTTRKSNDGAPPGDYLVSVAKTDDAPPATNFIPQDDPNYNPFAGKNTPRTPPKSSIPGNYADAKTSGLTARVNADKNTIDFDLN